MKEIEAIERALQEKRYFEKYSLAEPTLERLRGVCDLLGAKSIEELGRNLSTEILLTTRFDGDETKVQRLLKLCLNGVETAIEGVSGAALLEVEQDFFMRYVLTSGLLQRSLERLSAQADSLLKVSEVLTEQMKKVGKSKVRKRKRSGSSRKLSGLKLRRAG